ncbi:MAG: cysteine ABC transporter ATP-binding protein, partial [Erysipelotrichaceae bacterium]|nr:cysteine ABC transporter ATP-binding protein [Erysipelotrichaceae bacterium]
MMDKQLMGMLKGRRKRLAALVALMLGGMLANIGITACICLMISQISQPDGLKAILIPAVLAALCTAARYVISRAAGSVRDSLGRSMKKELREKTYDKLIRLGLGFENHMSMAGLTQVAMEGIEQLDLYFSVYIPQFFFSILAPFLLFGICVWIDWRTALVLLACVPLIPASIIAVSKYAKRIFAKYWDKYISMGDKFLDSVQGMQELKIYRADERQHERMNENAEVFRKITM